MSIEFRVDSKLLCPILSSDMSNGRREVWNVVVEDLLDEVLEGSLHQAHYPVLSGKGTYMATTLFLPTFKKVSTKSTRSSRIQSRGPRPETSMSM